MIHRTWTDTLGRTYRYRPHIASLIADAEIALGTGAVLAVGEAARALGTLPSLPLTGIATVLFRSESAASSLIEGIEAGPRRVLEAEFANAREINDPRASRIVSNLDALVDALSSAQSLTSNDLLRWHGILTTGHPELTPEQSGQFRTVQNWIGGDSTGPRKAIFIPPPPEEIAPLVEDLLAFVGRTDVAGVPAALLAHAQFEVIHPFVDGNGRVGRMLLQYVLARRYGLAMPVPVSIPWSQDRDRYLSALRRYQNGDVEHWIEFGATSLVSASEWMNRSARRIKKVVDELRSDSRTRGNSVAAQILTHLPEHPLVDAPSVAERYGVSKQAASQAITRLSSQGVLKDFGLARRVKPSGRPRRYYCSPKLLRLLQQLS